MHLESARLCLDCDEIHQEDLCPACASSAFVYLARWIPLRGRAVAPRLNIVSTQRAALDVPLKKSA
jgi:hypothetical protein